MGREELMSLVKQGPVAIKMNNGDVFEVPSAEFILTASLVASVLVKGDDGKFSMRSLSLRNISSVEQLNQQS